MIYNLDTVESPASRMLDLIARCAPKMMRMGGGALPEEPERQPSFTPEERARIFALAGTGEFTATDIARQMGKRGSQAMVQKLLARHGIRTPDGRKLWRQRRAAA